jgi:hypothetical protein
MARVPVLSSKNSVASFIWDVEIQSTLMNHLLRLATFSTLLTFSPAFSAGLLAEDLEEILARMEEANGGRERIEAISDIRFSGTIESPEGPFAFVLFKKRPDKLRMSLQSYPWKVVSGYDGTLCWREVIKEGQRRVFELEGADRDAFLIHGSDFDGPLLGSPPEDVSRSLVGMERIGRVDHYVIEIQRPKGVSRHYIDSRTYRESMTVNHPETDSGNPEPTTTRYSEYQRHQGLWIAHRVERETASGIEEVILIKEVQFNQGVLDMAFAMPEK